MIIVRNVWNHLAVILLSSVDSYSENFKIIWADLLLGRNGWQPWIKMCHLICSQKCGRLPNRFMNLNMFERCYQSRWHSRCCEIGNRQCADWNSKSESEGRMVSQKRNTQSCVQRHRKWQWRRYYIISCNCHYASLIKSVPQLINCP